MTCSVAGSTTLNIVWALLATASSNRLKWSGSWSFIIAHVPGQATRLTVRRALVIQHEASTPGGYVHEWLRDQGAEEDVLHIYSETRRPRVSSVDLVVSLGSEAHAYDDSVPWLARELQLLVEAAELGVPVLGICFGGQLLARALGGAAARAPQPEIGWLVLSSSDPGLVPPGPWFQWHFDSFTAPPGACLMARTPAGPQAYALERSVGLQFHPEVTPQMVEMWATNSPGELRSAGVDPDALVHETHRHEARSRAAAWRLFDGLLKAMTAGGPRTR